MGRALDIRVAEKMIDSGILLLTGKDVVRMRGTSLCLLILLVLLTAFASPVGAVDVQDTRMLHQPTVSAQHVAFVYGNDLWIVDREGGRARQLTSDIGDESSPHFSPDGSLIAFTGEYDGNRDVYVMPAAGGTPTRLSWHPGADIVQGFTPDGSAVLFTSSRQVYTRRYQQLYTVPLEGGFPTRLAVPHAAKASYSPDGSHIAYLPLGERFRQWKNYRGGTTSRIWLYDIADHSVDQVPQPEGRCNDTDPMWFGATVYFLSDRDGEFNLFAHPEAGGAVQRLTNFEDFPIISASAGAGVIVFAKAGYLHLFDPAVGESQKLTIGVAADLVETRPRYVDGGESIRNTNVSPSGARAVFEARGEIVTVPAEKGNSRNLTHSPGVHDRSPAWSPDGKSIAWFSDEDGEYALFVAPQDGRGKAKRYALDGAGFYEDLKWAPGGDHVAFVDNSRTLYVMDMDSGRTSKVGQELLYGPFRMLEYAWAPDSKWIAYTQNDQTNFKQIHLYSIADNESFTLSDGLSDVGEPAFDASGKYLFFYGSTNAGPVRQWFAMSNADMEMSGALYMAVLAADTPDPLAAESDEVELSDEDDAKKSGDDADEDEEDAEDGPVVRVDREGLDQRILALPLGEAHYSNLVTGEKGQLYYLKSDDGGAFGGGSSSLCRFDLESREEETLGEGVMGFVLSADAKKMLYVTHGDWYLSEAGSIEGGKGKLDTDAIRLHIEPRAEWPQIFDEAWRINRDYFYATNYHGADWDAMRSKYAVFLPDLATRDDLNLVIQWMCSELAVGHHRNGGGDDPSQAESVPGGLLGADYEIAAGRYRFAKVYGGLNWNPELQAPLTKPGVNVVVGEYLLAVDGVDLAADENLFARFEHTADRIVELTVGPRPDGKDSRSVQVVPLSNERALRNRDWVEGNLRRVTEATDGRVAYVYVPNTAGMGHTYFKRYFYPQADREAIIVDERHNGGGQVADYYIDILRRPFTAWWAMRYGADLGTPMSSIQGPKAMLIDETAGSGGDLLPWMFRKFEMGTLVGRRTWGGLVGVLGFPTLMDGGFVSAPNIGIWTEDGGWVVENQGVPPDVEVEQWPAEVIAGHDPQLEKAIQIIMEQLPDKTPEKPKRPPFPVRARQ